MEFQIGHIPWNKGKTGFRLSNETRKKMSIAKSGRVLSTETRTKLSLRQTGNKNHNYGKPRSEETRQKIGLAQVGRKRSANTKCKQRIAKLQHMLQDGITMSIGQNEKMLLDQQERSDDIIILRQYPIQKLGYTPDGYCPENNTVYEVYERRHLRPKVAARDAIRQKEIEEYLGCKFVIIWDLTH